jgi:hypothetical protein
MRILFSFSRKFTLAILILAFGLALIPASSAFAAGSSSGITPPANDTIGNGRLERMWAHAKRVYDREGFLLSLTDGFITRVQNLIDRAKTNGWDVSAVQSALNAFDSVIPAASAAHLPGAAILTGHAGFDSQGKVADRTAAIGSINSLEQVIRDTHAAMNGTGKALKDAVRAFREAHQSDQTTVSP